MFDRLPLELLELVMKEVWQRTDRQNLAYSCKAIYQVMRPYLWQDLKLIAGYFYHQENILKNKHFIQNLTLSFNRKDTENLCDFLRMMFDGESVSLSYLFVEGNVPDEIFYLLISKSAQLRKLNFSIRTKDSQWDYAGSVLPSTLKKVQFWESTATDAFLESIIRANVKTLESLDISLCDELTQRVIYLSPNWCTSKA